MPARHALWLVPADPVRKRLAALIEELARAHATAPFAPHVTVLSGLASEGLADAAAALARTSPPLEVTLTRVDGLPERYRALFLEVEGVALGATHARAAASLGVRPDPEYRPHLSLLYGELDEATKGAIADRIGRQWNEAARLDRLDVVKTEGDPESWVRWLSVPLGRG